MFIITTFSQLEEPKIEQGGYWLAFNRLGFFGFIELLAYDEAIVNLDYWCYISACRVAK